MQKLVGKGCLTRISRFIRWKLPKVSSKLPKLTQRVLLKWIVENAIFRVKTSFSRELSKI